jgi:hypothetical protein
MSKVTLEIAVFSVQSALDAIQAGAHRIELCENPNEGGTTPSYGSLLAMSKQQTVPVFPIIRPRGGDFLYSDTEYQIIKQDVLIAKELGFKGVVIGLLKSDGSIDKIRTAELVALAKQQPGKLTFASYGAGSPGHLAGELFKLNTKTQIAHVPYSGAGPALTDLVAGHVDRRLSAGIHQTERPPAHA